MHTHVHIRTYSSKLTHKHIIRHAYTHTYSHVFAHIHAHSCIFIHNIHKKGPRALSTSRQVFIYKHIYDVYLYKDSRSSSAETASTLFASTNTMARKPTRRPIFLSLVSMQLSHKVTSGRANQFNLARWPPGSGPVVRNVFWRTCRRVFLPIDSTPAS